jgi:hypothetical protein
MQEVRETKTAYRRIAWLLIVVNLSVPIFVFFQRSGNNLSDTVNIWVGWISAMLVTAMLVVGTYLRLPVDRRQIPGSMVLTSIALVVLSGLITTISIAATPSDNYLAVALSDRPLNQITPRAHAGRRWSATGSIVAWLASARSRSQTAGGRTHPPG